MWTKPEFPYEEPGFFIKKETASAGIGSVLKFILLVFFVKNTLTPLPKWQTYRVS